MSHDPWAGKPPWERPGAYRRDGQPHRNGALMALGVASCVIGFASIFSWFSILSPLGLAFGLWGWHWSRIDLQQMETGLVDPRGREDAEHAWGCAVGGVMLSTCAFVLFVLLLWLKRVDVW
jgi:hypothetical protein